VAGSREGSRQRELRVTGADAERTTPPADAAVPATAAAVLLAASNRARTRSAIAASLSPIFSMICSKNITGLFRSRKTLKNAKTTLKIFTVRGIKNLHRYLRILRYVNWWIFLDSILKINPRKLAIKKHLVKIYTQMQDSTFRTEKHSEKAGNETKNAAKTNKLMKRYND
jgi:hypothetical protein